MTALRAKLEGWIGERYPLASIRQFLAEQTGKRLPVQTSWWHTIGSLLLFLTVNQIVTGILLMVYYRPSPETAFESVHHIMTRSHFGWLIRGLHAWGATLMIVLLVAHMLRTFITGSFKKPRELTWVSGVVIFCLVLVFGFTGYLLPWNQTSYWGTTVGTEISGAIPAIGGTLRFLSRGGDAVGGETLARYYVVHVAVLPWILVAFVGMHLFLVRLHGIATLDLVGREQEPSAARGVRFFPEHVAKEALVFSVFFAIFVAIVFLAPIELGERADPFRSPPGIKPEWYFLPTYQVLKFFPKTLGVLLSVVPFVALFCLPFLDRSVERHPRHRPWSLLVGGVALTLALGFGLLGYLSERTVNLFGTRIEFDMAGMPHRVPPETSGVADSETTIKPPAMAVRTEVEDGRRMLIAAVSRDGKPLEGVRVAFSAEVESVLQPIGEDATVDDGTAAVPFPEGIPGGPKGELRIVAETRTPAEGAGTRSEGVFLGGIPVTAAAWRPDSLGTRIWVTVTLAAGVLAASLMYLFARSRRAVEGTRT